MKNGPVSQSCSNERGLIYMGILARAQLMNRVNVAGRDSGVSVRLVAGYQGLLVRSWGDKVLSSWEQMGRC